MKLQVDEKYCSYLPRPRTLVKACNMHCSLTWRTVASSACSASRCGQSGVVAVTHACMRVMPNQPDMPLPDQYCEEDERPPPEMPCEGDCQGVKWKYGHWSEVRSFCVT